MALSYEDAKKLAEEQKYGVTGSKEGIDESYIKALQYNTVQDYTNKIVNATRQPIRASTQSSYQQTSLPQLSRQDMYKRAENIVNPQIQQLKNNLILKLSQQRNQNVSNLASRGQAVGGQRELAEANINSEEALQGSNILLQGDIAKNQLAEQYMATAQEQADRQQALEYQQYMDSVNMARQGRMDNETIRQNDIAQKNYEAEVEYEKEQDIIKNEYDQGRLSIEQADLALRQAKFNFDKATYRPASSGSSTPRGMTDQEIRLEAIKRATSSDGYFDEAAYNRIYRLLSGQTNTVAPTLTTPTRSVLLDGMFNLGKPKTTTSTKTNIPTADEIYNRYASGKITEDQYYAELDKYGY